MSSDGEVINRDLHPDLLGGKLSVLYPTKWSQNECLCIGLGAIFSLTSEQNVDQTLQLPNSLLFV